MKTPSASLAVSTLALLVALGGTAGAAGGWINGSRIKPHSITEKQIKTHAITKAALADGVIVNNTVIAPSGPQGTPGDTIAGPAGASGPTGAPGSAKAWGYVAADGTIDASRSSGISSVAKLAGSGDYCIYLAMPVAVVVVNTVNGSGSSPLQAGSSGIDATCPGAYGYRVRTFSATGASWQAVDTPFVVLAA